MNENVTDLLRSLSSDNIDRSPHIRGPEELMDYGHGFHVGQLELVEP